MSPPGDGDNDIGNAMATSTDHDTFTPVADHYQLDNSCHTHADSATSTHGNTTRDQGSSPSSVIEGAQGIEWIAPSTRSALLPEDATTRAPDNEIPLPCNNGRGHEKSSGNLQDSGFLRPAFPSLPSYAPNEFAGSDDGTKITECLNNSPGPSNHTDLAADALVAVPPRVHSQNHDSIYGCRAPDNLATDPVDANNTSKAGDGDVWNLTITGLAEHGTVIATPAKKERPGTSWNADDSAERSARSTGVRFAHGKSTETISLPVSWGGVAKFEATTATTSSADNEVVPPAGVGAEQGPRGTTIDDNHVPTSNSEMPSNPSETGDLTMSLQLPLLNPVTSSSSDWDWIADHARGTPSNVATIPVEVPLAITPQVSTISFDDATSTKTPLPPSSPSTVTSPYSRSASTKSGITTHSAETERRDNFTIKPKGSAVTTHSAVTEPRRNTSHPAAHPLVVGEVGPETSHHSQQPSRMYPAEPPPAQVVATWERSLVLSLAASATPGLNTPPTASDLGLPATRLSTVMCRGADVAPPSNHPVTVNLGSADHLNPQVGNTKQRLGKDHRYPTQDSFMAIADDSTTDFCFQQEASIRKHSTSWHIEKRRTRRRNVWIFLLTVAFVAAVTVTASVLATRSSSTSSDSTGSIQPGSGETKDPPATVSPPVLINASATDTGFVTDGEGFMEWQSSQGTTDFGSLVALNNDGSIVAITERLKRNNSNAMVHIVPRDSEVETQSILLESEASSLALNANGTVLAVGLRYGTVSTFELDPTNHLWVKMGETIVPPGILEYQKSNHSLDCNVSVSLSDDGHVIAMGLVTPYNVAFFQVMKFDQGGWSLLGPTIQIGDDGSSTHVAASVVLSPSCSPNGQDCILTMSRMFQSERFLFGMIAARGLNTNQTSWDSLGQALPFSLEAALASLSHDGTVMAVSDASATSVYRLSDTERSSSSNSSGTQSTWKIQGQEQLPKAYQVSLAGSGRRLALATAEQALVYDLVTIRSDSNETSSQKLWNLTNTFAWDESFSAMDGGLCMRLSANGMLLALGAPNWPAGGNETGRVVVFDLD